MRLGLVVVGIGLWPWGALPVVSGSPAGSPEPSVSAPAGNEVLVGVAVPRSGRFEGRGRAVLRGAERQVEQLNALGGLLGSPLATAIVDDACDGATAVAVAKELVAMGVAVVVGHPCAGAAVAAASVYDLAGVVFIASSVRTPALTDKRSGATIFRLAGRDDRQWEAAALWLGRQPGTGPFAVVHDRTRFAREISRLAIAELSRTIASDPIEVSIDGAEKNYDKELLPVIKARPRAVLFAGYPAEASIVLSSLRKAMPQARFLGTESLATDELASMPIAADSELRVLRAPGRGGRSSPETPLVPEVDDEQGAEDAVAVWAEAVRRAGSKRPSLAATELHRGSFETAGPRWVSFDSAGDAITPAFVPMRWREDGWRAED